MNYIVLAPKFFRKRLESIVSSQVDVLRPPRLWWILISGDVEAIELHGFGYCGCRLEKPNAVGLASVLLPLMS